MKRRYGVGTLLMEDAPISKGLIQSLKELSINVTTYTPDTDKRSRLIALLRFTTSLVFSRQVSHMPD